MGRLVVESDTGEVVANWEEGDRIIKGASIRHLEFIKEWKMENFYKGNLGEIRKWLEDLTPNEKALLFTVSPYIGYDDCCLRHDNGKMITFGDIVKKSGLSRGAVSKSINSLIVHDILYRGRNSGEVQYFINPWLFCKGNRVNKVIQTMFRNYKVRVCNGIKWGQIRL